MVITKKLNECAFINPKEIIPKGTLLKKVTMEKLQPFCRDITEYERGEFRGGTKFRNDDTIMARITPCLENGKTAKINFLDDGEIGFGSTEYIVFRAKKEIMDSDFLYYLIISPLVRETAIKSMVGSSGRQRVQTDVVANIEVKLPSLLKQRNVANILKHIDDKIATNTAINKNLESQAQAIFKSWFVDFEPFDGEMPRDWIISTLGSVSKMGAGGDKPKIVSNKKTSDCQYPIYSNGLSEEGLYGYTNNYKIDKESVTVSARGTIGFVCLRHIPYTPIVRLVVLEPNTDMVSAQYLYFWLKNINIAGTGTTQQQLTVPAFRKEEILLPNYDTMQSFTNVVSPLFNSIWHNQEENQILSQLRDTLLPRLMSGEIDVENVEV